MAIGGEVEDGAVADPDDIGTEKSDIVARWLMEFQAARRGPYKRWLSRAKKSIRRYRDEDMDNDEAGARGKRNAQFNVLWSNIQTVAPSVYSKPPSPIAERRYLDRDVIGRAAATILQRVLSNQIEVSDFHEVMKQCRTDLFLVGIGNSWLRYEATYKKTAPQHQDEKTDESAADGADAAEAVETQKICLDYCHWSDELFGPARYWQELPWRAKRAYYSRRQLIKKFGERIGRQVPLKVTRGKKQNDVLGEPVKETIGKAEVWQVWDFDERKILYICEDYAAEPLGEVEDMLRLSCFVPSARPVRGTTTNDTIYPIPDYSIWHDQAAELDSLTMRIAALTRAIKAVGAYDASVPELERILNEGMENKLIGIKNWAKLTQKGGLPGAVSLLPIKELTDALTALYLARAQVKNDLYEISGVSDIVRGASDPNETAAAQKMKGQFSSVRGGDRKAEFDRYVRDTLVIMAEIAVEHFTDDTLWLMSDFEQWAKDQDLKAYFPQPQPPMMGHNGGPPLDGPAPPMQQAGPPLPQAMGRAPEPLIDAGAPGSVGNGAAAPPMPMPPGQPPAPMASSPGIPPVPGLPMPVSPGAAMPGGPAPIPPMQPPAYDPALARQLFGEALKLLREDKLRSFRIQVETNSTIEPDATQEQQSRVEFLGAVTQFLAQASEMGAAYPQLMPVLGKFLLFGARGFKVGRDLESALEGMIGDLERQARNPAPKKPTPDEVKAEAIKAKAEADKELAAMKMQGEQQKLQMELRKLMADLQAEQQRLQMEMQKLQMQLQAEREKLQIKREEGQIKLQTAQQAGAIKQAQGEQQLALSAQEGQIEAENMERRGELEAEGMERQAEHDERTMGRKEQHDETRMELAERAARQKAKTAAKPAPRA